MNNYFRNVNDFIVQSCKDIQTPTIRRSDENLPENNYTAPVEIKDNALSEFSAITV